VRICVCIAENVGPIAVGLGAHQAEQRRIMRCLIRRPLTNLKFEMPTRMKYAESGIEKLTCSNGPTSTAARRSDSTRPKSALEGARSPLFQRDYFREQRNCARCQTLPSSLPLRSRVIRCLNCDQSIEDATNREGPDVIWFGDCGCV